MKSCWENGEEINHISYIIYYSLYIVNIVKVSLWCLVRGIWLSQNKHTDRIPQTAKLDTWWLLVLTLYSTNILAALKEILFSHTAGQVANCFTVKIYLNYCDFYFKSFFCSTPPFFLLLFLLTSNNNISGTIDMFTMMINHFMLFFGSHLKFQFPFPWNHSNYKLDFLN